MFFSFKFFLRCTNDQQHVLSRIVTHWDNHPATDFKLLLKCGRNIRSSGCNKYSVKWSKPRKAFISITKKECRVITYFRQERLYFLKKLLLPFYSVNPGLHFDKHSSLITGAGSNFKYFIILFN